MLTLLRVKEISKSFGGICALDRVSITAEAGEVHAITGENGAGKSTLMRIIAGLERPDRGEMQFHGRGIAMIHQELTTFPDLSVAENIWMGRLPGWVTQRDLEARSRELLARIGIAVAPSAMMRDLSIAEQQSVEVAKAVSSDADLIIMDEPTSALSARESEALFHIIADLQSRGTAIVYISHRMPEIFRLATRVTVLRDGRHVLTTPTSGLSEDALIAAMVGREVAAVTSCASTPGPVVLDAGGVSLRRGEIVGLAGLIGAGRTELATSIAQQHRRTHRIAMVTEDRRKFGFVPDMSITENVTLASSRGLWIDRQGEARIADEQIRALNIRTTSRDQPVGRLSGGNQQKTVLARALLTHPDILILDEPTRGIDVGARAEIYTLIGKLAAEGKAILLISSEMNEILALSHRILVMREGQISAELSPSTATPDAILKYAMPN